MLKELAEDAIFVVTVFFEVLASLSIMQDTGAILFGGEPGPVLLFYREHALPVLAFGARLFPVMDVPWFADAYLIAEVLFFLFFIGQARRALAPYDDISARGRAEKVGTVEAVIDAALPVAFCAIGAILVAITLLPFLTLPAALWLAARRLLKTPCWFAVGRSYYVNAVLVASAAGLFFAFGR
jgi:hypothetical protein